MTTEVSHVSSEAPPGQRRRASDADRPATALLLLRRLSSTLDEIERLLGRRAGSFVKRGVEAAERALALVPVDARTLRFEVSERRRRLSAPARSKAV